MRVTLGTLTLLLGGSVVSGDSVGTASTLPCNSNSWGPVECAISGLEAYPDGDPAFAALKGDDAATCCRVKSISPPPPKNMSPPPPSSEESDMFQGTMSVLLQTTFEDLGIAMEAPNTSPAAIMTAMKSSMCDPTTAPRADVAKDLLTWANIDGLQINLVGIVTSALDCFCGSGMDFSDAKFTTLYTLVVSSSSTEDSGESNEGCVGPDCVIPAAGGCVPTSTSSCPTPASSPPPPPPPPQTLADVGLTLELRNAIKAVLPLIFTTTGVCTSECKALGTKLWAFLADTPSAEVQPITNMIVPAAESMTGMSLSSPVNAMAMLAMNPTSIAAVSTNIAECICAGIDFTVLFDFAMTAFEKILAMSSSNAMTSIFNLILTGIDSVFVLSNVCGSPCQKAIESVLVLGTEIVLSGMGITTSLKDLLLPDSFKPYEAPNVIGCGCTLASDGTLKLLVAEAQTVFAEIEKMSSEGENGAEASIPFSKFATIATNVVNAVFGGGSKAMCTDSCKNMVTNTFLLSQKIATDGREAGIVNGKAAFTTTSVLGSEMSTQYNSVAAKVAEVENSLWPCLCSGVNFSPIISWASTTGQSAMTSASAVTDVLTPTAIKGYIKEVVGMIPAGNFCAENCKTVVRNSVESVYTLLFPSSKMTCSASEYSYCIDVIGTTTTDPRCTPSSETTMTPEEIDSAMFLDTAYWGACGVSMSCPEAGTADYQLESVVTVPGVVADFTEEVLTPMIDAFAARMKVDKSKVTALVTAGSVKITFTTIVESLIQKEATLKLATAWTAAEATVDLGVAVESIAAPISVARLAMPPPPPPTTGSVSPPTSPSPLPADSSMGPIIGGVVGGVIVLILIGVAVWCFCKKGKKTVNPS